MQESLLNPERQRQTALERYDIRNTSPDEVFDRITRLAARLFSTPVSLVTLADQDDLWFKSNLGVAHRRTPRPGTFCNTVIQDGALLVVPDAHEDERFNQHPCVADEPFIRFYAGAPLRTEDDCVIGTLCIFDTTPRAPLTPAEEDTLRELAALTMDELELRRTGRLLKEKVWSQVEAQTVLERAEQRTKLLADRLKAVTAAATGILTTRTLEELQEVLCSACAKVLAFDYFDLGLYDEASHTLHFLHTVDGGVPVEAEVVSVAGKLSEYVVRERRSLLISTSADPRVCRAQRRGTGLHTESIIRTPIMVNERVLGVLSVQSYLPDAYTSDDVEVLEAVSALAASALQNLKLLAERQMMEAQRKRVEQNLRRQKQRFRSLVRNSSDLITLLNEHGTVLFTSPSITRLLGYPSYELIGANGFEQIHPEDRVAIQASFAQVVTTGENAVLTYRFRDISGKWLWLESVVVNLLHDPSVKAVTINSRDITERKQHEQSLQKLVEQTAASPEGILPALVQALAEALAVRWAFAGQLVGNEQIETLAVHGGPDFTFPLAHSACEHVFDHETCFHMRDVAQQFPDDGLLAQFGVNAYLATPLYSRNQ